MFNCHIHTFNASDTPDEFFKARMEKLPGWLIKIIGRAINNKVAHYLLGRFMGIPDANVKKMVSFLYIGTMQTQDMIFESAASAYPQGTRIASLSINFQFMGGGKMNIPYVQQLEDLLDVRKKNPDTCMPFVFIDPRMGNATENLQFVAQYIKRGCVGIKMYPSLGYYPFDKRLELVYEFAAKYEIPIMIHCSRGGIYYYGTDMLPEFMQPDGFNMAGPFTPYYPWEKDWKKFKNNFLKPSHWSQVLSLEKFKNLKICLAHFGYDSNTDDSLWQNNKNPWFLEILDLIKNHENVYTDISYTLYDPKIMQNIILPLFGNSQDKLMSRILYGTDYYMTIQETKVTESKLYTDAQKILGAELFNKIAGQNCNSYFNSQVWQFN
jgi:predicted TIM-barrel fold metal-dependent hydrolase